MPYLAKQKGQVGPAPEKREDQIFRKMALSLLNGELEWGIARGFDNDLIECDQLGDRHVLAGFDGLFWKITGLGGGMRVDAQENLYGYLDGSLRGVRQFQYKRAIFAGHFLEGVGQGEHIALGHGLKFGRWGGFQRGNRNDDETQGTAQGNEGVSAQG